MLISVNGTIIDTKRIYKIDNIDYHHAGSRTIGYSFSIFFNNNEKIKVVSKDYVYNEYDKKIPDFVEFRDSIIKIWQENQSEIPQFNT